MRDQRHVRRRHFVIPQPVWFYPGELLPLGCGDLSLPAPANIERHQEMEAGIGMARESEWCETGFIDDDAQFLLQLPDQTLFRRFTIFDLAAGKLPQACHRLAGRTLSDQHPAVGIDEGAGGNKDDFDAHSPTTSMLGGPWLRGCDRHPELLP